MTVKQPLLFREDSTPCECHQLIDRAFARYVSEMDCLFLIIFPSLTLLVAQSTVSGAMILTRMWRSVLSHNC